MSSVKINMNIPTHMVASIKAHGGLDYLQSIQFTLDPYWIRSPQMLDLCGEDGRYSCVRDQTSQALLDTVSRLWRRVILSMSMLEKLIDESESETVEELGEMFLEGLSYQEGADDKILFGEISEKVQNGKNQCVHIKRWGPKLWPQWRIGIRTGWYRYQPPRTSSSYMKKGNPGIGAGGSGLSDSSKNDNPKDDNSSLKKSAFYFFLVEHEDKIQQDLIKEYGDLCFNPDGSFKYDLKEYKGMELWKHHLRSRVSHPGFVEKFENMARTEKRREEMRKEAELIEQTMRLKVRAQEEKNRMKAGMERVERNKVQISETVKVGSRSSNAGFELWKAENEADIRVDFPKLSTVKFLVKCMELWKKLDEKERKEWDEAAVMYKGLH